MDASHIARTRLRPTIFSGDGGKSVLHSAPRLFGVNTKRNHRPFRRPQSLTDNDWDDSLSFLVGRLIKDYAGMKNALLVEIEIRGLGLEGEILKKYGPSWKEEIPIFFFSFGFHRKRFKKWNKKTYNRAVGLNVVLFTRFPQRINNVSNKEFI